MVMRLGETPVPISNTTVKTETADGTWWGTAWESRRLPAFIMRMKLSVWMAFLFIETEAQ